MVERQDIIYRRPADIAHASPGASARFEEPPPADLTLGLLCDPVLLFRFSCATANAHRIHYDATYASAVEGYPGLVIHGPLLALLLLELPRRRGLVVTSYRWRALAPLFVGAHIRAFGHLARGRVTLHGGAAGAWQCIQAEASLQVPGIAGGSDHVE